MEQQIIVELEQAYEWLVFIKDNILPIVLSALAAIIASIGGVSTMLNTVRNRTKKEGLKTEELNKNTIATIQGFKNEYKVIDNKLKELLDNWQSMKTEFDKVKDLHDQLNVIKTSVQMIATEDPELVKSGVTAAVVEELDK
jgi:peptidoglycan hydrolase CwlO-like protein